MTEGSATSSGLQSCHTCQLVVERVEEHGVRCPRCFSPLHDRKPDSLARTWALLVSAVILYIPANVYPIMSVVSFGAAQSDTIMSGVIHLYHGGMWPLAALVFFASVVVPVLKMVGIAALLISVQRRWRWSAKERTRLYRMIEFVGRWSMVDVFMVSILAALVQLGAIATIFPGVGASAFCAVVILTMLASMSFDPRLIWDRAQEVQE